MRHFLTWLFVFVMAFDFVNAQHSFYFDAYNTDDNKVEESFDSYVLVEGGVYELEIEGTYSIWQPSYWTNPCGTITNAPIYPSTAGSKTGLVGFDMEYVFSLPSSRCAGKTLPYTTPRIECTTDNGSNWSHPSTTDGFNPQHIYHYQITGEGYPLGIRQGSGQNSDDYGQLKITIKEVDIPVLVDLGKDTTLCQGEELTLRTGVSGAKYTWQDGSTDSVFEVSMAGLYWVLVEKAGKTVHDTISVSYAPKPNVNLGMDTTLCDGQTLTLSITPGYQEVRWNDLSTSNQLLVNSEGTYFVQVRIGQCVVSDTIEVIYEENITSTKSTEMMFCVGQPSLLWSFYPDGSNLWNTGEVAQSIEVNDSGLYWAASREQCHTVVDTFYVALEDCSCGELCVPTAFSPNGDGLNDVFAVHPACEVIDYQLTIYNRWGELVFSSGSQSDFWTGHYLSRPSSNGLYVYRVQYKSRTGVKEVQSGTFLLQK